MLWNFKYIWLYPKLNYCSKFRAHLSWQNSKLLILNSSQYSYSVFDVVMFEISYFILVVWLSFIIIIYLFIVILRLFSIEHPVLDSKCCVCIELNLSAMKFSILERAEELWRFQCQFSSSQIRSIGSLPWIMNFGIKWKLLKMSGKTFA